jgi:thiol-disulfide isomerase/thioredoxin
MITVKNPRLQFLKPLILMVFTYYLFFCIDTLQAQNHEINFVQTKWKEVLLKSKKEKKLVFLDCYTSWCGPCFWMKKNVFVNDSVADFYNKNFIPVKMDMEKGEGLELAKTYKINSYPTFLYLNEKGEILHRSSGSADVQPFIETGKNALNPEKQLATQTKRFYENPTDELIAYEYFKTLKEVELLSDSIIRNYFSRQKV